MFGLLATEAFSGQSTTSSARPPAAPLLVDAVTPRRRVLDVPYLLAATLLVTTARVSQAPALSGEGTATIGAAVAQGTGVQALLPPQPLIVWPVRLTHPARRWTVYDLGFATASYQPAPAAITATGSAAIGAAAVVGAGAADNTVAGAGTATIGALQATGTGEAPTQGTATAAIGAPAATATGSAPTQGTGTAGLSLDTTGAGQAPTTGSGTAAIGGVQATGQNALLFRGTLRATRSLGPWLFATITLSPGDTMTAPALALDSKNYVDATNLKNRRTGTALETGDVTGFTVRLHERAGRRLLVTKAGTVESATRCYAELEPADLTGLAEGVRVDVEYVFTMSDGDAVRLWDLNVVAGRVEA